jgi:hypothetical protein
MKRPEPTYLGFGGYHLHTDDRTKPVQADPVSEAARTLSDRAKGLSAKREATTRALRGKG